MTRTDVVIQTEHLHEEAARWLAERCRLEVCSPSEPRFSELLAIARGLVVRTYTMVDESLLARGRNLRVVARAGVGLDNIDVPACRSRGIEVVYAPDANTQAVVEYVICLLCDALRPRLAIHTALSREHWIALREAVPNVRQMNQTTLGILGLGRVGKRLAAAASAIGFQVIYNDLLEIPGENRGGAAPVCLTELFQRSDVVSLHIDPRPGNRKFVNADLLNRMKSDAVLINTARGMVVDNFALRDFLVANPGARAMLDVHEPEPFGPDYPLLGLANVKLYPHLAARTHQAMANMSWVVRDVAAVLEGKKPQFPAP